MIESYLDGKQNEIQAELENRPMSSIFRIVLNHWPILSRSTRFVKPFVNEVEPNLILKGDSHYVRLKRKVFRAEHWTDESLGLMGRGKHHQSCQNLRFNFFI